MRLTPLVTQPEFDADLHFLGPDEQAFQLQRRQPNPTMPEKQPQTPTLVPRHMPGAVHDFLRYQFGIHASRFQEWPEYDPEGKKVTGFTLTNIPCTVFHLLGFGPTQDSARRMALRALEKLAPALP